MNAWDNETVIIVPTKYYKKPTDGRGVRGGMEIEMWGVSLVIRANSEHQLRLWKMYITVFNEQSLV